MVKSRKFTYGKVEKFTRGKVEKIFVLQGWKTVPTANLKNFAYGKVKKLPTAKLKNFPYGKKTLQQRP